MIILGLKTAILGPQFCRILVLGPHVWWLGGPGPRAPPGSTPGGVLFIILSTILKGILLLFGCNFMNNNKMSVLHIGHTSISLNLTNVS